MSEEVLPVIIDNGTLMMKAGFGGDDAPRAVFPNIVKRPRHRGVMVGMAQKDAYVGDECNTKRGVLKECYPMKNGIIISWRDIEKVWHHTFYNELRIQPEEHCVLLTEHVLNARINREKTTEIMFETFNVPCMYLINTAVTSLYASGRTTGIVLESGSITSTVPIYDGYALRHAVCTVQISGDDLTNYLMKLLCECDRGYTFTTAAEREIVRDIKEKLCYMAYDFDTELAEYLVYENTSKDKFYELPDGHVITICQERIQCFEVMFKPEMMGKVCNGVHEMIYESIMECGINLMDMCGNIVLSGGNSLLGCDYRPKRRDYFVDRLTKEVNELLCGKDEYIIDGYLRRSYGKKLYKDIKNQIHKYSKPVIECNVIGPEERKYSSWIGASIFSLFSDFDSMCINKNEYDDIGKKMIHRKCF